MLLPLPWGLLLTLLGISLLLAKHMWSCFPTTFMRWDCQGQCWWHCHCHCYCHCNSHACHLVANQNGNMPSRSSQAGRPLSFASDTILYLPERCTDNLSTSFGINAKIVRQTHKLSHQLCDNLLDEILPDCKKIAVKKDGVQTEEFLWKEAWEEVDNRWLSPKTDKECSLFQLKPSVWDSERGVGSFYKGPDGGTNRSPSLYKSLQIFGHCPSCTVYIWWTYAFECLVQCLGDNERNIVMC